MNYLVNIANIIIKLELVNDQDILPMASRFFLSNGGKPDITIQVNVVKNVNNSKRLIPDVQTSAWTMANIDGQKKFEFLDNGITTAQMLVNEDYTQITLDISRSSLHDIMPPIYVMVPIISGFLLLKRNGFFIHGALVRINGQGVLLTGKSGAGKSTLSSLFNACGHKKIGDDRLILTQSTNGRTVAYSTPFDLKMESLVNESCEIHSILFLEHSADEFNSITKFENKEAINKIIYTNFLPLFAMDKFADHVAMCYEILRSIPMFSYAFIPNTSSVFFLNEMLNKC